MKYEIIIFLFIPPIMVSIKFIHSVLSGKMQIFQPWSYTVNKNNTHTRVYRCWYDVSLRGGQELRLA